MEDWNPGPLLSLVKLLALLLFAGLPVMSGYCWWRNGQSRQAGDEAMARSWRDAARSFTGLTITGLLLLAAAWYGVAEGLRYLAEVQRGG